MRLIDADRLKETLDNEMTHPLWQETLNSIKNVIFRYIDERPTARDADKAIERIRDYTAFLHYYGNAYAVMMLPEVAQLVDDIIGILEDEENEN